MWPTSTDPAVQFLLDRAAIGELMTRYCRSIDRCDRALLESTEAALRTHCPTDVRAVVYDDAGDDGYARFVDPGSFTAFEPAPESIAVQPYTSGSTGRS